MRFLNGKNKVLLFVSFSLIFSGCTLFSTHDYWPTGTWQYESVKKGRKTLFEISPGDTLNLNPFDTFNYVIQKAGKKAHGTYTSIKVHPDSGTHVALVFTYFPAGNKRIFNITHLSATKMTLREGNLYFRFRRIR